VTDDPGELGGRSVGEDGRRDGNVLTDPAAEGVYDLELWLAVLDARELARLASFDVDFGLGGATAFGVSRPLFDGRSGIDGRSWIEEDILSLVVIGAESPGRGVDGSESLEGGGSYTDSCWIADSEGDGCVVFGSRG